MTISMGDVVSSAVVTQGSTTSGQSGELVQAAVTTAAPSYNTSQTNPLSMTLAGGLRVDLASAAGTTLAAGTGTQANALRVVHASAAIAALGQGTPGTTAPSGAVYVGGLAATANPTAVTGGQLVGLMTDKLGKQVLAGSAPRDLTVSAQISTAGTGETTLLAATASEFHDLKQLVITTVAATAGTITVRENTGGTTKAVFDYPNAAAAPGSALVINFDPPLTQSAVNQTWTIQNSNAGSTHYLGNFIKVT